MKEDLALDFMWRFLYFSPMIKATVIILSLVWASLLLISWGSAEDPSLQTGAAISERRDF